MSDIQRIVKNYKAKRSRLAKRLGISVEAAGRKLERKARAELKREFL